MPRPPLDLESLDAARARIDAIDDEVLALLGERSAIVDRVMVLKAEAGVAAAAPTRVATVLAQVRERAGASGVDPEMAEAMWRIMIEAFIAREQRALGTDGVDG